MDAVSILEQDLKIALEHGLFEMDLNFMCQILANDPLWSQTRIEGFRKSERLRFAKHVKDTYGQERDQNGR